MCQTFIRGRDKERVERDLRNESVFCESKFAKIPQSEECGENGEKKREWCPYTNGYNELMRNANASQHLQRDP